MKWYGMFYDLAYQVPACNDIPGLYSLCGCGADGKLTAVITYYSEDDASEDKEVRIDFGKPGRYEITLVDADHDGTPIGITEDLTFRMKVDSCILIKEI